MTDIRTMAERAHQVFKTEDWTYWGDHRPTVEDLEDTIRELIGGVTMEDETMYVSSGRFRVEREVSKYEDGAQDVEWNIFLDLGGE